MCSLKARRKSAGWDNDYLPKGLTGSMRSPYSRAGLFDFGSCYSAALSAALSPGR
jgi:hypothetical protein